MIKSVGCHPKVILSKDANPLGTPDISSFLVLNSSIRVIDSAKAFPMSTKFFFN
jgi:hypothetical protein